MRVFNYAADRDQFLQDKDKLIMPAVNTWRDGVGKNALVLERTRHTKGLLEQRNLRRDERDPLLDNYRLNGLTRGNVMIKTLYAGICGSDMKNAFGQQCAYDFTPGRALLHEVCGVVIAIGDGVVECEVGDLVVANPLLLHDNNRDALTGEQRNDRTKPFSSIQTHGFGQEVFIHPASHIHRIDPTRVGPRAATLVEPLACAHGALERVGGLTERLKEMRKLFPEAVYGQYNFTVMIVGGGNLGMTMAVMAKHRGANTVIVLDNNPEKVARINALGKGFHGICTDWMKNRGESLDTGRRNDMHQQILRLSRTTLLNSKGVDMLVNCVSQPLAAFDHIEVLSGSVQPIIVQAGGSHGAIAWDADINRGFMTNEATYAHAYRYKQSDLKAAIECIYARQDCISRLVGSITPASRSGAHQAMLKANSDKGSLGKMLINYAMLWADDDVFQNGKE